MRNDHNRNNDVGNELKAVAQDVLQLGARCVRAGRDWLSEKRSELGDRDHEHDHQRTHGGAQPGATGQTGTGRSWQHQQQGSRYGSRPVRGEYDNDYYASRDHGRDQAHGQGGLHRERGQQGGSYTDYGDLSGNRSRESGHAYGRDSGYRQSGEGYGGSSGYGSPSDHSYLDDGGRSGPVGQHYVSPGFTQMRQASGRSYRGMGPRNYKRSDARITEDLCERLTHDHDIDASDIELRVNEGHVILEGTVEERWMKHRAEDIADSCSGVRDVDNRIRVKSSWGTGSSSQFESGSSGQGSGAGAEEGERKSGGSQTGSPTTPTSTSVQSGRGSAGSSGVSGSSSSSSSSPGIPGSQDTSGSGGSGSQRPSTGSTGGAAGPGSPGGGTSGTGGSPSDR